MTEQNTDQYKIKP